MQPAYTPMNKEPWLAGSLSLLLPGAGHIYSRKYKRGTFLIIFAALLYVICIGSLVSVRTSVYISMLLNLCRAIILPLWASFDASKLTKRSNTENFERERTLKKDPWLAVFLSVLLPGIGHIYLRKYIVGILFLLSFFLLRFVFTTSYITLSALIMLPAIASTHAYGVFPFHKIKLNLVLMMFTLFLLCLGFLKIILIPLAQDCFFVRPYVPLVGPSMEPTILDGSRLVVNKFTYLWNDPTVGDIILFYPPGKRSSDHANSTCKRIVARGGETVQVVDGNVYVDGIKRESERDNQAHNRNRLGPSIYWYGKGKDNPYCAYGVSEPYRVPEGHYFVLGDNHSYSDDSRYFGAVPRENIKGKVIKIFWPLHRLGTVN